MSSGRALTLSPIPDCGGSSLEHVEPGLLEHVPIPLHVVAVDVVSGEELLLSTGLLVDAIIASASIPAVLPPVPWEDRALADGGVANNKPISHAIDLGAREIYVLPTVHACVLERPPPARSAWRCTRSASSPVAG